jgi:drug/metabolite transporter (DMT)-like permease
VNPAIAIFLGWAILSENVTATMLVGAVVIVCSVAATVRRESG